MKDILLITPPFTQLNTPYPATAYLKGFLNTKNISAFQMDLGMEVILEIFSKNGLKDIFDFSKNATHSDNAKRIFALKDDYLQNIDEVISFLQGKNQTFARQICTHGCLPQAARFKALDDLEWAFGNMGVQDKAKHLATLFLEDISDYIIECVDENFGFSRYAERLGRSANQFDELYEALKQPPTYIDQITLGLLDKTIRTVNPKLICFSVPFPGNLYSAFRSAKNIKAKFPTIKIAMGGGFPNTELRGLKDKRVFEFFDYITLDDGELPIELLVESLSKPIETHLFKRTFLMEEGEVFYNNLSLRKDYKQSELGTPDYSDLPLNSYISVIELANPMHSLWSDGRWNKLTMAHGCYWGKCTFCDVSLDYIKLYEPIAVSLLVDRMQEIIAQTKENGFHFVDEAAPPALMKSLAIEIIKRKLKVTWWTNIRFEKSFTKDLCVLLKNSGCIAVSGGLEVASDRLLALIQKGVTVKQVAQVTNHFTETGIMVHAYLMYGYPTQTVQETVDSLEMVRQMFELEILQSGFWHQFALTAHSPVGLSPAEYGIIPEQQPIGFAHNDIQFKDKTGIHHDKFSYGLKKSLFNYMHGICFDLPLQEWFDFKIPKTTINKNFIENSLILDDNLGTKPNSKVVWLGNDPEASYFTKSKKGNSWEMIQLIFNDKRASFEIALDKDKGDWLVKALEKLSVYQENHLTFHQLKADFESDLENFELFWHSKPIKVLRENGLLLL
ncbi:radical SAM protein [Pedobacter sp. SD-b]|uniref:Radical SAM protein n=1 Tax=Pedobacter segetis TaxID=2793069 RepID=A0ABS1BKL2_9SPHI|nr:radical SAM protein [Pedobacter segetis]MBK0382764.1 radical SAM protein [Pedobacter segetis]